MNRVRYAEDSGNNGEVRYFIDITGLDLGKFPQLKLMQMIENVLENKKLKDMTPSEIIEGVKSGRIKSESYNSVEEYMEGMHGEDKK